MLRYWFGLNRCCRYGIAPYASGAARLSLRSCSGNREQVCTFGRSSPGVNFRTKNNNNSSNCTPYSTPVSIRVPAKEAIISKIHHPNQTSHPL